jgi:hypothetical protein
MYMCILQGFRGKYDEVKEFIWHTKTYYYTVKYKDGTEETIMGYVPVMDVHELLHKKKRGVIRVDD